MLILKFDLNGEFKEQTGRSVSHIALRIVKRNRSSHCTSTIFLSLHGHHEMYRTSIRSARKKWFYARPRLLNKGVKMGSYSFTKPYSNYGDHNRKILVWFRAKGFRRPVLSVGFIDILERIYGLNQLDEKRIYNINKSEFCIG